MKYGPITKEKREQWSDRARSLNMHAEHHPHEVEMLLASISGSICETPWWRFIAGNAALNLAETIQRDHHECCGIEDPDD